MGAFLFIWNPGKWKWHDLDEKINILRNTSSVSDTWSCVSHKKIKEGDRAFLLRLGEEPKGIIGSGYIASYPFLQEHWGGKDKLIYKVVIEFDVLINATREPILDIDILSHGNLARQTWLSQSSGISIKQEVINELEDVWFSFLKEQKHHAKPFSGTHKLTEGKQNQVVTTRYERNPHARKECLEYYGFSCQVCEIKFHDRYGGIGKDFIHVHHQAVIADADGEREVNPIKDLIPVCPNCHAMLHKKKPPYTIEELQIKLNP
ncbi:MAG: HNH endonuclease [Chloroflexi bacterium]|nr:HNH endonuclease [Chloroflexota bacterium]